MQYKAGLLTIVLLLCGCRKDISGSYIATGKNTVCWLQLVRTPDNHLTGQITFSTLTAAGSIERKGTPITGAINEDDVTLTMPTVLGFQTGSLAGTLQGNKLTLTGAEEAPLVLVRSDLVQYEQQVKKLEDQSQLILAAKQAAAIRQDNANALHGLVKSIKTTIEGIQTFNVSADTHLQRLPLAENGYRSITQKVSAYVDREKRLAGNPEASVARGQLAVAAYQASLETGDIHNATDTLKSTVQSDVQPLAASATKLKQLCDVIPAPNELTQVQESERVDACKNLLPAISQLFKKYEALQAALSRVEDMYVQERDSQRQLLTTADRLK